MVGWLRVDGDGESRNRAGMAVHRLLVMMGSAPEPLTSIPGLSFCAEYMGTYKSGPGLLWGKSSPDFLMSPIDGFPALVITVGAWWRAWFNDEMDRLKAQHKGYVHAYLEPDSFDGCMDMGEPPAEGEPIFFWYWDTTNMRQKT